jgi:hypothetical protein
LAGSVAIRRSQPDRRQIRTGYGRFRKARWARPGKGKSGGFRAVYFLLAEPGRIYMAAIYAKSRVDSLSGADNNVLAKIAAQIKKAAKGGERS